MAEIEQFIDPQAEAQIEKYLASLQGIATSYDKIFNAAVKTEQAITKISRSSDDAEKKQRKTNEAAKEAERIAKEQASAAAALEKQRQAAINAMGVQEAKQRQLNDAINMEVKSLQDATTQNSALQKAKKQLDLTTEAGRKKLTEYNRTIDKNTEFIRHNSDMMTKQKMNIGNYAGSIREALAGLTSGGKGAASALGAMTSSGGMAGVAIGAVALAANGLGKVLTITNDLADKFAVFTGKAKAATDYFFKSIALGDFSNFLSGMKEAIQAGKEYAETMDDLGDRQNALTIQESESRVEILKLRKVLNDATLSDKERIAAADKIITMEDTITKKKRDNALMNLKAQLDYSSTLNRIDDATLLDLIKNYDAYTKQFDLVNKLTKAESELKNLQTLVPTGMGMSQTVGSPAQISAQQKIVEKLKEQTKGFEQSFKAFANVSDEERKLITDAAVQYSNALVEYETNTMKVFTRKQNLLETMNNEELQAIQKTKAANEKAAKEREDQLKREREAVAASINAELIAYDANNQSKVASTKILTDEIIQQEQVRLDARAEIQGRALDQEVLLERKTQAEVAAEKLKIASDNQVAIGELKIKMAEQTAAEEIRIEKEKQEQIKAQIASQVEFEKRMHDVRNNNILRALAQGQISRKQAEDQQKENDFQTQAAILQSTMSTIQKQIDAEQVGTEKRAELVGQLMENQTELEAVRLEYDLWTQDQRTEKIITSLETIQNVTNEISSIAQGFFQAQSEQLDAEKERQLAAAGENAARREQIEKEFAIKQAQLKRKQAIAEKATGVFNIGINTAMSIVKTGAELGYPAAIPFQVLAGILGAAQMAVVLAKPLPEIPKFAKGTKSAPGGISLVGEAGRELLYKDGKAQLVSKPTLVDLTKGTQVLTNRETERILQHAAQGKTGYDSQQLRASIEHGNRELINAINNKRELQISASGDKITDRQGNYYKTYFNRRIRWAGK